MKQLLFIVAFSFSFFSAGLAFAATADELTLFQKFMRSVGFQETGSPVPSSGANDPFSSGNSSVHSGNQSRYGTGSNPQRYQFFDGAPDNSGTGRMVRTGCDGAIGRTPQNFKELVCVFVNIIELLNGVVILLALLFFFWGTAKYINSAGDEKAAKEGKDIMIWGAIALFVAFSLGGILAFIGQNLGFDGF